MRSRPRQFSVALALLLWLLVGSAYLFFSQARISPAHAQDPAPPIQIVELGEPASKESTAACPPRGYYQNEELVIEDEPNYKIKLPLKVLPIQKGVISLIHPKQDTDYYYFLGGSLQRFSAATSSLTSSHQCSQDTRLDLYNASVTPVASDNDSGRINGDTASSIAGFPLPAAGKYYLRVSGDGIGTIQPYQLYTDISDSNVTNEIEPNGSTVTSQGVAKEQTIQGTVAIAGDLDYFKTTLNAGDTIFLSLDMDPNRSGAVWDGRVGLGLFNGGVLLGDDNHLSSPRSEAMIWTVRDNGTYYILVDGNGAPSSGPYHLNFNVYPRVNGFNCTTHVTTDIPKAIGPGPGTVESTIAVTTDDIVVDLNIKLNVNHTLPSDLRITLKSPIGTTVPLVSNVGDGFFPNLQTGFDDEAAVPPYPVYEHITYQPQAPNRLATFDGQNQMGTWTLVIDDTLAANGGTLLDWQLEVCNGEKPAKAKLVAPANHSVVTKPKATFDWYPSYGAFFYNLEVRRDSKTEPQVVNKDNLTASQVKAKLDEGHDYFWRVFACNADGCRPSKWFDFEQQ